MGFSLVRLPVPHLLLFALHVVGYSATNTALPTLLSHYSPASKQGRAQGIGQAAAALSRVASPLLSGLLYDGISQSAPFLVGAAVALAVGALPPLALAVRHGPSSEVASAAGAPPSANKGAKATAASDEEAPPPAAAARAAVAATDTGSSS